MFLILHPFFLDPETEEQIKLVKNIHILEKILKNAEMVDDNTAEL